MKTTAVIGKALALRFEARWQTASEFQQGPLQALGALPQGQQSFLRRKGTGKLEAEQESKPAGD